MPPLLNVKDLKVYFKIRDGWVEAVDGVSFTLREKETLGLVGESGCGKTTTAYAITQLLPRNAYIKGGKIVFMGEDLLKYLKKDGTIDIFDENIRKIRWNKISIIFQGAMDALNPVYKVGKQIEEAIMIHRPTLKFGEITERVEERGSKLQIYIPVKELSDRDLTLEDLNEAGERSTNPFILKSVGAAVAIIPVVGEEAGVKHDLLKDYITEELKKHKFSWKLREVIYDAGKGFMVHMESRDKAAEVFGELDELLTEHPVEVQHLMVFTLEWQKKIPDSPRVAYSSTPIREYTQKDARRRVVQLYRIVGLSPDRIDNYPHEYSGGMKQRALIAMALALNPPLVIADEPTTALDVITQYKILREIKKIQERYKMAMIIISHDISTVAEISDKMAVMYAGRLAELARTEDLFKEPKHPYTVGLLKSIPTIKGEREELHRRLASIPGSPPPLVNPPSGCRFHPRCPYAKDVCREKVPRPTKLSKTHIVWCHKVKAESEGSEW